MVLSAGFGVRISPLWGEPGRHGQDRRSVGAWLANMVDTLLVGETAAVYTLIDRRFADHFARWGFRQVGRGELPPSVSRIYLIGRVVTTLGSLLRRQPIRIVPLLRPAR